MHKHFLRPLNLLAGTGAVFALAACGGSDNDGQQADPANAAKGSVAVSLMTDAPSCGLDAFNVTVSKLRLRQDANPDPAAAGWTEVVFSPAKKINLLNLPTVLSGATTDLGSIDVPAGIYSQLALVLDPNTSGTANTVRVTGATADVPLETAATVAGGVRLPVDLNVQPGQKSNLVIDFDACNAYQMRGTTYVLKPRARPLVNNANGIGGFVDKAALASGVVITAQKGGTIFATTAPNTTTGEFVLPRLTPDTYDLVVTARGRATDVIGAIPVPAAAVTNVSTAAAPLVLPASAVSSIAGQVTYTAPNVAPADGTYIMASQSISADPTLGNAVTTVTYRLQPVDLATGNYVLTNLPRASVMFAQYKPTLPLSLVPATTSGGVGRYRVETVATGYTNKTSPTANINASTADVSAVNIALP